MIWEDILVGMVFAFAVFGMFVFGFIIYDSLKDWIEKRRMKKFNKEKWKEDYVFRKVEKFAEKMKKKGFVVEYWILDGKRGVIVDYKNSDGWGKEILDILGKKHVLFIDKDKLEELEERGEVEVFCKGVGEIRILKGCSAVGFPDKEVNEYVKSI